MSRPQTAPALPAVAGTAGAHNALALADHLGGGAAGASARIIAAHSCPGCRATAGERCRTKSGRPARIHILRIGEAKHAAVPGPCPNCGIELVISRYQIRHVGTEVFGCAT